MNCRNCASSSLRPVIDLGTSPIANDYLLKEELGQPETWFPLKVVVCSDCYLVQTVDQVQSSALFEPQYAYFSSNSSSWLQHAEAFVSSAVQRFRLGNASRVIEVASNDGYLLKYVKQRGIPCLGIEPTHATASAARKLGITTLEEFLGEESAKRIAREFGKADLVVANNVLAHVPNLDDFLYGIREILLPDGVLSIEFPLVSSLVDKGQFDTIYHEHFSYFSVMSADDVLQRRGLQIFDLDHLSTHGGSVRLYVQHSNGPRGRASAVDDQIRGERSSGLATPNYYSSLNERALAAKTRLLAFLLHAQTQGARVMGYGAAAKGNTLLNFAGIRPDLLPDVVDKSPSKIGKFLPGSRLPIFGVDHIRDVRPDYVLILPWNLTDEIKHEHGYIHDWGGRFVTPSLEHSNQI